MAKVFFFPAALALGLLALSGCSPGNTPRASVHPPPQATAPTLPGASASTPAAPARQEEASPAPAARPQPPQAPEQALIDTVEQAYQKGLADYHAGQLETAKTNFDHAVDLMLTSKFDLRKNTALNLEFNRIVDAINAIETEALKQGNGFAPATEPSPVDVANDVTFPVNPKIKAQAIAELKSTQSDLPLVINDPVASYISYFSTNGKGTLERALERAGRYRGMISRILAQAGVPQDLIYQAVAESGFQPQAVNRRSGAGGMWQFMPTGPYGLERDHWVDERFDPLKSTLAYARYIKLLYNQLGDWYLAMAAYDWGPGNVQRAVERTGYADFWELYRRNVLPQETKNYVPIIIAAAIMAKNPQQYGLESLVSDPPLISDSVTTTNQVSLRLVADIVGAPIEEIVALNPSLLRMCTPEGESYDLHLPAGAKELYEQRIALIPPDKRDTWRFHKVVPGDTLASLANKFKVSTAEIADVNRLPANDDLAEDESLVIPVTAVKTTYQTRSSRYRIRRGDTLITIADRFNVPVQDLRRWNHLRSERIEVGHMLYIAEPARVRHTTRRGTRRHEESARHTAGRTRRSAHARNSHATSHAKSEKASRSKTVHRGTHRHRSGTETAAASARK